MMTAAQQQNFDDAILTIMDRNRSRFGLTPAAIRLQMQEFGFLQPSEEQIMERLDYLVTKKLAVEVDKQVHRANRTWRITDAGIDHLDQKG